DRRLLFLPYKSQSIKNIAAPVIPSCTNDIVEQYVKFTKVINEQIKIYGYDVKAVTEAIRICRDEDILREYLSNREKEVVTMMCTLFSEEKIMKAYEKELLREGRAEGENNIVKKMRAMGMSEEEIDRILSVELDKIS
ncbi:MAG: hypothetical protein Q4G33_03310, partial [bacterium]|nr:hypothetical protein [bacterium]